MKLPSLLTGASLGAATMYLLDPERGNARQSLLRDAVKRQMNVKRDSVDVMVRDLSNRAEGVGAELRVALNGEQPSARVLEQRVRTAIGRRFSHARHIQIEIRTNRAILSGPVLVDEIEDLIHCVKSVRGIRAVENRLDVRESRVGAPGVSLGYRPTSHERWSPAVAGLASLGGAALLVSGLTRRGIVGTLTGIVGSAILAKSFSDVEHRSQATKRGSTAGPVAIAVQSVTDSDAPPTGDGAPVGGAEML